MAKRIKNAVTCNKCGRNITLKLKTKKKGNIEYQYFTCNRCKALYVVSATDEALRQEIEKFKEITSRGGIMTPEEQKKAEILLKQNVERSRELLRQHPLELKPWER